MKSKFFKDYKIRFIIQEDKGIVIAKIININHIPDILIQNGICAYDYNDIRSEKLIELCYTELNKMRGIAKCDEKDIFNIKTGKHIAYLKLYKKYLKFLKRVCHIMSDVYSERINNLVSIDLQSCDNIAQIEEKLSSYGTVAEDKFPN